MMSHAHEEDGPAATPEETIGAQARAEGNLMIGMGAGIGAWRGRHAQ
jgi:hypothetical protein